METYIKIDDEIETIKEAYITTCSSRESGLKQFENNTIEINDSTYISTRELKDLIYYLLERCNGLGDELTDIRSEEYAEDWGSDIEFERQRGN